MSVYTGSCLCGSVTYEAKGDHRLMRTDDEVVAIVVRDSEMLQENVKRGVAWLDSQRPLLQEYNEVDRHTLPMTGDLVE